MAQITMHVEPSEKRGLCVQSPISAFRLQAEAMDDMSPMYRPDLKMSQSAPYDQFIPNANGGDQE